MDESTLSQANRDRLRSHMCRGPSQHGTFNLRDAELNLSSAVTESDRHDTALALFACLSHLQSQLSDQPSLDEDPNKHTLADQKGPSNDLDHDSTHKLAESLAKRFLVVPVGDTGDNVQDFTVHSLTAEAGLASLELLSSLCPGPPGHSPLSEAVLLSIVPYTNSRDPWTTNKSADTATQLLTRQLTHDKLTNFIVKSVLQDTLRPLFSNLSANLTASGRPSYFRHHHGNAGPHPSPAAPAWKQARNHIIPSFHWAVKASDPTVLSDYWPLFLPVLLSLVEDETALTRENGLRIMTLFLEKCPAKILLSTGIDKLFQEAVFPTLLFLPTLTPEHDSINLLRPAYRVLLQLAQLDSDTSSLRRRHLLDRLLRDGILAGYYHASQHIRIVQVLMECTEAIVSCLGLFTAKHLQNLLHLFSAIMTDPFAMTHPPAISAATKALNATVVNCWPRFSDAMNMEQVIHTVALCWLNMRTEMIASKASHEPDQISVQLMKTSTILQSLWNQQSRGPPEQLTEALEREPQLAELFPSF